MSGAKVERYAPWFAHVSTSSPVKVPSLVMASLATVTWSRPWESVIWLSVRVATQRAGRPISRATHGTMTSSG